MKDGCSQEQNILKYNPLEFFEGKHFVQELPPFHSPCELVWRVTTLQLTNGARELPPLAVSVFGLFLFRNLSVLLPTSLLLVRLRDRRSADLRGVHESTSSCGLSRQGSRREWRRELDNSVRRNTGQRWEESSMAGIQELWLPVHIIFPLWGRRVLGLDLVP